MGSVLELALILVAASGGLALITLLLDRLLARESSVLAVARVLLREAYRRRIVPCTFVTLVLGIGVLALWGGADALPQYRVRTFITFSLEVTTFFLAGMTLLLACGTLADEIERRRVFTTLVKPVRRVTFLVGKWLGLLLVNASLLAVLGGLVAVLAVVQARAQVPEHRDSIESKVLVARAEVYPVPEEPLVERARAELESLRELDVGHDPRDDDARFRQFLREQYAEWLTVGVGEREAEVYLFRNIPAQGHPRLVLRPELTIGRRRISTDEPVKVRLIIGDEVHEVTVARDQELVFEFGPEQAPDGVLRVIIEQLPGTASGSRTRQPTLRLNRDHAIEVLHDAGGFAGNLLRALLVVWIKLAFCAALGLCAASFLGFPVAMLTALIVVTVAATSSFIVQDVVPHQRGHAHGAHGAPERDDIRAIEWVFDALGEIGQGIAGLLVEFSRYSPVPRLADGRLVPWREVGSAAWLLGLVWAGGTLAVGAGILSRRELARVQV